MNEATWTEGIDTPSINKKQTMQNSNKKTDSGIVTHALRKWFWPGVAIANGLIFIDFVFNNAEGCIWLLFFLTGGYSE